jgi:hypothetical protein
MDNAKKIELIETAKSLLQKGWCKEACARDAEGKPVGVGNEKATAYCLLGALEKAEAGVVVYDLRGYLNRVEAKKFASYDPSYTYGLSSFNDAQPSVEPVIKLLSDYQDTLRGTNAGPSDD